jgi:hypothetical protein
MGVYILLTQIICLKLPTYTFSAMDCSSPVCTVNNKEEIETPIPYTRYNRCCLRVRDVMGFGTVACELVPVRRQYSALAADRYGSGDDTYTHSSG